MIAAAGHILLEAALRALIVASILSIGIRLLRVGNAPAQKAAWTMVLAASIAMPLVMRSHWHPGWAAVKVPEISWAKWPAIAPRPAKTAPVQPLPAAPSYDAPQFVPAPGELASRAVEPSSNFDESSNFSAEPTPIPTAAGAPENAAQPRPDRARQMRSVAWLLYLGVAAALLLRLLFGLVSSIRLWVSAPPAEAEPALEVPAGVRVRWTRKISSPVNIGSGILLPADYAQWDEEKLRVVLAHESSHIRQHDFYLQLLAGFYAATVWFSPLGWWLKRKLSELGEAISDRAGLEAATSPLAYAELLLEFAARPRLTVTGVAMAHSTHLHQRIERLLNESSFRRVFAHRRQSVAALVVAAVLIAAGALVHVQAAVIPGQAAAAQSANLPSQPPQSAPQDPSQPSPVQSKNGQMNDVGSGATHQAAPPEPTPEPASTPVASPAPEAAPVPSKSPAPAVQAQAVGSAKPAPRIVLSPLHSSTLSGLSRLSMPIAIAGVPLAPLLPFAVIQAAPQAPAESNDVAEPSHRDSYTVMGDPGSRGRFEDHLGPGCIEAWAQAATKNTGHFLLVCHDGKPYIIDDPAIMAQVDAMDKALHDQDEQMKALSRQMRDDGAQARAEARKERKSATNIPTPDLSKEMAALNASVAELAAKQGGTVTRDQLAEIQREISAIQRRVIDAEVKVEVNLDMSKFNAEQVKLAPQMGRIGGEIGRIARENDEKIRSMIDESLQDGKAKPVN